MGKFKLQPPEEISVARAVVEKLIKEGDGDASLLYLYIVTEKDGGSHEGARAAAGFTEDRLSNAAKTLVKLKLIADDFAEPPQISPIPLIPQLPLQAAPAPAPAAVKSEIPAKTELIETDAGNKDFKSEGSEMQDSEREAAAIAASKDPAYSAVADECQIVMGKQLSSEGFKTLAFIYHDLGMPADVIIHLLHFCAEETIRAKGEGKRPGISFIEKKAYDWSKLGINSLESAEAYINELTENRKTHYEIRSALHITDHKPVTKETETIDKWLKLGFNAEAITVIYEYTVFHNDSHKWSWAYADKIIESCAKSGCVSAADIERQLELKPGKAADKTRKPNRKTALSDIDYTPKHASDAEWLLSSFAVPGSVSNNDFEDYDSDDINI